MFFNDEQCLETFTQLDDNDIWCALKTWANHEDKVLATLSSGLVNRRLFKVEIDSKPFSEEYKDGIVTRIADSLHIDKDECSYLLCAAIHEKDMYTAADDQIEILYNDGTTRDIAEASDMFDLTLLQKKVKKHYICYHRV